MRPSTPELIGAIVETLEREVAPHLKDKWAASALRSATQLLAHVALRTESEGRILLEDNRDARAVLEATRPPLAGCAELTPLADAVRDLLSEPEPSPADRAALDARNVRCQAMIERLLGDPRARALAAVHSELRAYLGRRLAREHALYFPVFTGAPF